MNAGVSVTDLNERVHVRKHRRLHIYLELPDGPRTSVSLLVPLVASV